MQTANGICHDSIYSMPEYAATCCGDEWPELTVPPGGARLQFTALLSTTFFQIFDTIKGDVKYGYQIDRIMVFHYWDDLGFS